MGQTALSSGCPLCYDLKINPVAIRKHKQMQYGMIGLGRMGANMARRLLRGGHEVVVSNRSPEPVEQLE